MILVAAVVVGSAQPKVAAEKNFAAEVELAKKAVAAHGGDKLMNLRSLVIKGAVDVTISAQTLLQQMGKQGFVITALPEGKKKQKGFRMTSPEGFYTDFYLDEKTNQIKGYDASYDINGRHVTTSV